MKDMSRRAKQVIAVPYNKTTGAMVFKSTHDCADYFNELMVKNLNSEQIRRIIEGNGLLSYTDIDTGNITEVFLDYLCELT